MPRWGLQVLGKRDHMERHLAVRQASGDIVVEAGLSLGGEQRALACAVATLDEGLDLRPELIVTQDLRGIHEGGIVAERERTAELAALAAELDLGLQPFLEETHRPPRHAHGDRRPHERWM